MKDFELNFFPVLWPQIRSVYLSRIHRVIPATWKTQPKDECRGTFENAQASIFCLSGQSGEARGIATIATNEHDLQVRVLS